MRLDSTAAHVVPAGAVRADPADTQGAHFAVRYADPGYARLGRVVEREKHCQTRSAALKFCVLLRHLGGRPIALLQSTPGEPDSILGGRDLEEMVGRLQTI